MAKLEGSKYDGGKAPLDLLSPDWLFATARVLDFGKGKYDAYNWYKGIPMSRLFGALLRHLWQFWKGEDFDEESGLPHLGHASCCLMFLFQMWIERRPSADDRNIYQISQIQEEGICGTQQVKESDPIQSEKGTTVPTEEEDPTPGSIIFVPRDKWWYALGKRLGL